jgi:type IV pilus assembly protein PilN
MSAIRINLLPHRQIKRAQQQRLFVGMLLGAAALGALVVAGGHLLIANAKDNQNRRNELLRQEMAVLDKQIEEIKALKEKTQALLARKGVVESLQTNRAEAVHLFDELARRIPEGLYLKGLKQAGDQLSIQGYAQSSARVSTLMRNLDESPWLEAPNLVEVRAAQMDKQRVSEFNLTVRQTKQEPPADKEAGKP